jgi:hypothetical protein
MEVQEARLKADADARRPLRSSRPVQAGKPVAIKLVRQLGTTVSTMVTLGQYPGS